MKTLALIFFILIPPQIVFAGENAFDILAKGLKFGIFVVETKTNGVHYNVDVVAEARGIFGILTRAKYKGTSQGMAESSTPTYFEASSKRIFKNRTTRITFVEGLPSLVLVKPEKDQTILSDPSQIKPPRIDPLTFIYRIEYSSGGCPEKQYLYDGRRLTEVSFQVTNLKEDNIFCQGTYEIKEGPDHSLQKGFRLFQVQLIYKKNGDSFLYELNDVQITSGKNRIRLQRHNP